MRALFEANSTAVTPSGKHPTVCKCTMCMTSKLPAETTMSHMHELQSTMVDRRNPDASEGKPLMKAAQVHAILQTGTEINMLEATGIKEEDLSSPSAIKITMPTELTVKASWKNKTVEAAVSGCDASVFGALGVLVVPQNVPVVDIPKMNARAVPSEFLARYGAELIPLEQSFHLDTVADPSLKNLYLIEYQWDSDYVHDYVMKKQGGGGLFVETHPFPHVFTPLSPQCAGALILGVDRHDGTFNFAAFEIPFGYTMKINSNVIHGDSFFVGPYAIALTQTELADSVLFRQDTPGRDIQRVVQTPMATVTLDLAIENRLAIEVMRQMLTAKMYHEKVSFFKKLPKDTLSEIRNLSSEARQAYDEERGIVPYHSSKA